MQVGYDFRNGHIVLICVSGASGHLPQSEKNALRVTCFGNGQMLTNLIIEEVNMEGCNRGFFFLLSFFSLSKVVLCLAKPSPSNDFTTRPR